MGNGLENIPEDMIGEKSTILNVFSELVLVDGLTIEYANNLEGLLPDELKTTTVWFDKKSKLWRYYYGFPIDNLQSGFSWTGTTNHLPIKYLYVALKIANENLTSEQLNEYSNRLKDPAKHNDVLFEMRPLIKVGKRFKKHFEVGGYSTGNTTLDWRIGFYGYNIVFDVKNRIKSLVNHLEEITPHMVSGKTNIIPSAPDPKDLFKSVEKKLIERNYLLQLQGVWINTQIQEHKAALVQYYFNELNLRKVHFMIISDWKEDAYILARNKFIKYLLKKLFHISESERFVTEQYH